MNDSNATRILEAWTRLEAGLRRALPVCSVQPPTQPLELLSALRINGQLGPEEEDQVLSLRELRNRVAHDPDEPEAHIADDFEASVRVLLTHLGVEKESGPCC